MPKRGPEPPETSACAQYQSLLAVSPVFRTEATAPVEIFTSESVVAVLTAPIKLFVDVLAGCNEWTKVALTGSPVSVESEKVMKPGRFSISPESEV